MKKEFKIAKPNKPTNSDIFFSENGLHLYTRDGDFYILGADSQTHADSLIAAHNPPAPKEPTVQDKLASVGLTIDDLKAALGL